ncbi:hypothetical protein Nepgr_021515 [Nepenthes gracilis]|uniref:PWWP domain-containing protein n=1 Tax=Nepenthes gracilis TaxID=150966 RepID=A0AAD3SYQ4_NEPGR|nr:hypothetical protein Nepgr_021515 [Nepenthes gracilis]
MGSSDTGVGGAGRTDSGVGSIVWVRRRNGSWWPGRILGPDELSASHLISPRSGTPVQLLGREDASVDWYNLEKSKRVKSFRCGEFDACIDRAEASQGMPPKKREKYARREDAILHALELEKQLLNKKYGNLGTTSSMNNNLSNSATKDLATSSETMDDANGSLGNLELHHVNKKIDSSTENECNSNPLYTDRAKEGAQLSLENDNTEVNPQLRGLDFGDSTTPRKQMGSPSLSLNGMEHTGVDFPGKKSKPVRLRAELNAPLNPGKGLPNETAMEYSHPPERNPHPHSGSFAEEAASGSSEDTESDSLETDSMDPDVNAELTALSDANTNTGSQSRSLNRSALRGRHGSTSSDEPDVSSPDDTSRFHFHLPVSSAMEVSKWPLKGKRNTRSLTRRSADGFSPSMHLEERERSRCRRERSRRSLSHYRDTDDYVNEVDLVEDDFGHHGEGGLGNRGYSSKPKSDSWRQNFLGQKSVDGEELTWGDRSFQRYSDEKGGCFNSAYGHEMLIDVDLKVQANHKGEHVPWVSLMSKLNGKAIIGRPIQVETLEDGSTDALLSTSDACGYNDGNQSPPPVWRTARRTASFRVPRPHLSSQLSGGDAGYQHPDEDKKPQFRKSAAAGSAAPRKQFVRKSLSHIPRPPQPQRMKKPPKKVSLSASQKTRTLSSIGNNKKLDTERRGSSNDYLMAGAVKPLVSGPATVACIPVKLVFSRLLEAVGRPPLWPGNKEKNPP